MNKKLLALLLAILMVAMSAVAMAADQQYSGNDLSNGFLTIKKTYQNSPSVIPAEEIHFTVSNPNVEQSSDPSGTKFPTVTVEAKPASAAQIANAIKVSLPTDMDRAGVFTYTITETAGNTAGVTYNPGGASMQLAVLVGFDTNGAYEIKYVKVANTSAPATKIDEFTFENKFEDGSFTLTKEIEGDLANTTSEFPVKVTLTSAKPVLNSIAISAVNGTTTNTNPTAAAAWTGNDTDGYKSETTVYVTNNTQITFANIPVGVEVAIEETQLTVDGVAYTADYNDYSKAAMTTAGLTATITNTANATVDTGVRTDTMPYILLMAFVAILAVAFVAKKRSVNE